MSKRRRRATVRPAGRRCLVVGCGRFVRSGRAVCTEHAGSEAGQAAEGALGRLARRTEASFAGSGDAEAERQATVTFRRRLERGDYGEVVDAGVQRVMAQAAAEAGLQEEIGTLRVTMARLLTELVAADDPLPVAHGVARVATAAIRAVVAQRALAPEPADGLGATLARVLDEMDAERDALLAARDAECMARDTDPPVLGTAEARQFGGSRHVPGVGVELPDLTSWEMDAVPRFETLGREAGRG